jgi:hypothetical protein
MVAPPLAATSRYIAQSVRKYYWVPTIATQSAPTRAELNAGTDLTGQVFAVTGFDNPVTLVDAPDFGSRFTSQVPGPIKPSASSITLYQSSTSNDVRTLLTRDLTGFIVILLEGDVTGKKMDVFPVVVAAATKQETIGDPAKIDIQFGITAVPSVDLVIP